MHFVLKYLTFIYLFVYLDYYSSIQLHSDRDSDIDRILQESREHVAYHDITLFDNRTGI